MPTILIVDDEANIVEVVRATLEDERIQVVEALAGVTALALAEAPLRRGRQAAVSAGAPLDLSVAARPGQRARSEGRVHARSLRARRRRESACRGGARAPVAGGRHRRPGWTPPRHRKDRRPRGGAAQARRARRR